MHEYLFYLKKLFNAYIDVCICGQHKLVMSIHQTVTRYVWDPLEYH